MFVGVVLNSIHNPKPQNCFLPFYHDVYRSGCFHEPFHHPHHRLWGPSIYYPDSTATPRTREFFISVHLYAFPWLTSAFSAPFHTYLEFEFSSSEGILCSLIIRQATTFIVLWWLFLISDCGTSVTGNFRSLEHGRPLSESVSFPPQLWPYTKSVCSRLDPSCLVYYR